MYSKDWPRENIAYGLFCCALSPTLPSLDQSPSLPSGPDRVSLRRHKGPGDAWLAWSTEVDVGTSSSSSSILLAYCIAKAFPWRSPLLSLSQVSLHHPRKTKVLISSLHLDLFTSRPVKFLGCLLLYVSTSNSNEICQNPLPSLEWNLKVSNLSAFPSPWCWWLAVSVRYSQGNARPSKTLRGNTAAFNYLCGWVMATKAAWPNSRTLPRSLLSLGGGWKALQLNVNTICSPIHTRISNLYPLHREGGELFGWSNVKMKCLFTVICFPI